MPNYKNPPDFEDEEWRERHLSEDELDMSDEEETDEIPPGYTDLEVDDLRSEYEVDEYGGLNVQIPYEEIKKALPHLIVSVSGDFCSMIVTKHNGNLKFDCFVNGKYKATANVEERNQEAIDFLISKGYSQEEAETRAFILPGFYPTNKAKAWFGFCGKQSGQGALIMDLAAMALEGYSFERNILVIQRYKPIKHKAMDRFPKDLGEYFYVSTKDGHTFYYILDDHPKDYASKLKKLKNVETIHERDISHKLKRLGVYVDGERYRYAPLLQNGSEVIGRYSVYLERVEYFV